MKLKFKLWVENEQGERIIGEGLLNLLLAIKETGSISKATKGLGISYRSAWGKLNKAETRLGYKLIDRKTGGKEGGGTKLTKAGENLLKRFDKLNYETEKKLENLFDEIFNS